MYLSVVLDKGKHLKIGFSHLIIVSILLISFLLLIISQYCYTEEIRYNNNIESIASEIYKKGKVGESLSELPLESALLLKLTGEIEGILRKTYSCPDAEVYFLKAILSGKYPILSYGKTILGYTILNSQEVWKVGMTGCGEKIRYPCSVYFSSDKCVLTNGELLYEIVFMGDYKHALIMEKILIYTYPMWSGHPELIKPPGCKIFR